MPRLTLLLPATSRFAGVVLPQPMARASVASYQTLVMQDKNAINLLAGQTVADSLLPGTLESLGDNTITLVPAGVASSVLLKRPDIQEAEHNLLSANADSGYARTLFETHGLPPPPAGALVNSTLGLLSIVASGNCVGLLPRQIAVHPFAVQHLQVVAVAEGPLRLSLGALARADAALKPAVRHFMAHLHRAAHHLSNTF